MFNQSRNTCGSSYPRVTVKPLKYSRLVSQSVWNHIRSLVFASQPFSVQAQCTAAAAAAAAAAVAAVL